PHLRRVGSSLRIADRTLSGKLVALLSVFASPLPVALARDHRAPRALAADIARRKAQVDECQAILDALRLMLDSACVQSNGAIGLGKKMSGSLDGLRRHTGLLGNGSRVPSLHRFRDLLETARARRDEVPFLKTVPQDHVKQPHVES